MKSTITIEREYFENEEGVPCVKRIVKEDGVFVYEGTAEVAKISESPLKIDMFDEWVDRMKNPDKEYFKRGRFKCKKGVLTRIDNIKTGK